MKMKFLEKEAIMCLVINFIFLTKKDKELAIKKIKKHIEMYPEADDPLRTPSLDPSEVNFIQLTWRTREM